jgi:PIN domain nuclease of toxin-antitoxin system
MGVVPVIVLDTHALVWLVEGLPKLGQTARRAADRALTERALYVSAITYWELTMLEVKKRLTMARPPEILRAELLGLGLGELPVTGEIGIGAGRLDQFHGDPADRIIAVTASSLNATLITADDKILRWDGPLQTLDART